MSTARRRPSVPARPVRASAPARARRRALARPDDRRQAEAARLVEEMQARREGVMRAMQQLRESWARVREWDQQLADTQAALADAHRRFGEFYDFVPTPFLVLDHRLKIVQINAACVHLLNSGVRHLGQPFVAYVAPEDMRRVLTFLSELGAESVRRSDELRVRCQRGWVPVQLTAKASERLSPEGGLSQRMYYLAVLDLTEVRRLEEQQRRSADGERAALATAKAKDEFIAMLSHELRTPLTPILAAADALAEAQLPEHANVALDIIRRNVVTEARLVDDLLDVARVTQKRLTVDAQPLSLHQLIDLVLADWAPQAIRAGLDVRLELGASNDRVDADSGRLAQVLRNLLGNALKFTDPGGRVRVHTQDVGSFVRVTIDDDGRGMTAAEVTHLFEPFADSRPQIASRAGLGLGLVISHGIVEAHGGRIRVRSPGRGLGTTVELELPVCDSHALLAREALPPLPPLAPAPPWCPREPAARIDLGPPVPEAPGATAAPPGAGPGARRVLLVEDHADSAETLSMVLSMNGFEVHVARTVDEARALAGGCDLMISDISLPDGSGLDLLNELRRTRPLRAIALSGYGSEEDRRRSRDAGFVEHLTKPIDIEHLLSAVQRVAALAPR